MLQKFFNTQDRDYASLFLRIALGIMLLPHGLQKLFGAFGGHGFDNTMNHFTEILELPYIIGFLIIMLETLGAIGLLLGFLTRFTSAAAFIFYIFAIFMAHLQFGFFMNWYGDQQGEGIEFHILVIGITIALFIKGSGAFSLDALIAKKLKTTK